jgi:hypothetical protein
MDSEYTGQAMADKVRPSLTKINTRFLLRLLKNAYPGVMIREDLGRPTGIPRPSMQT